MEAGGFEFTYPIALAFDKWYWNTLADRTKLKDADDYNKSKHPNDIVLKLTWLNELVAE